MSFLPSRLNLHSTYLGLSLLAPLSVHCTHLAKATPLDNPNYTTTQHLQSCSRMWLCTHIHKYTHTLPGLNLHSWSQTARRRFLLQSNPPGLPFHIFPPPTPLPQLHCHLITLYFTSQSNGSNLSPLLPTHQSAPTSPPFLSACPQVNCPWSSLKPTLPMCTGSQDSSSTQGHCSSNSPLHHAFLPVHCIFPKCINILLFIHNYYFSH